MIDPDSVPSSIEAAARQLSVAMSRDNDDHFGTGLTIRNQWSLWEADSPLQRDAAARYGIAHADDISGLIVAWARAIAAGDPFSPLEHCKRYHEHWQRMGTDSLSAGGLPGDPS